ncbi:MAG: cyclic nucleotide-binding domain-containing protein [Streptosporangiales bacterium]|nr:cyclic nucleotide-binding domain-containing protein [Streptosporangiales bacterium]MBO0891317.1 cyclic nucleotide-binding domain-containing protein [Acidothermales bacterium]
MTGVTVATLTRHPFLRGLSDEHAALLAGVAEQVHVPAKQRLLEEGEVADRFWIVDGGGPVSLDQFVPGRGHLVVETLGMGDVIGWSWLFPPYRWRFGAVARGPLDAVEFDGRAVRHMCADDEVLGYELTYRFLAVVLNRLQATRMRLLEMYAFPKLGDPR